MGGACAARSDDAELSPHLEVEGAVDPVLLRAEDACQMLRHVCSLPREGPEDGRLG